jgi:hypothetical protein
MPHDPFEYMDALNRQTDAFLYRKREAREQRERDQLIVHEHCISAPVPMQRVSDIFTGWANSQLADAIDQLTKRDVQVARETLHIVADITRKEIVKLYDEIDELRSEVRQLRGEQHRADMERSGQLTVLPSFIKKSGDVS